MFTAVTLSGGAIRSIQRYVNSRSIMGLKTTISDYFHVNITHFFSHLITFLLVAPLFQPVCKIPTSEHQRGFIFSLFLF